MKHTIYLIALLLLSSCNNFLNITPDGQVSRDDMLSTDAGIEDALYGAYAKMRTNNLYGSQMTFGTMDVLAQYLSCTGNATVESLLKYDYQNTSVQDIFEDIWTSMYNNVSNVNSVLGSKLVSGATTYPHCIYRGEALAMRAYMLFDLVRLFADQITQNPTAKGIPYATEFSLDTPAFETLGQNYAHILADLTLAETLLQDEDKHLNKSNFMSDRCIHLNLHAVRALLARVYLTMGNHEKALHYARLVIEHSGRELCEQSAFVASQHGMMFPDETLFGLYHGTWFDDAVDARLQKTTSFYSYNPTATILNHYVGADRRGGDTRSGFFGYNDGSNVLRLMKLSDENARNGISGAQGTLIPGINMIKLVEMYYIAAECLLAGSNPDPQQATRYMTQVYDSRGVAYEPDYTATLDDITEERYREMIGEGQMFFNYKRLGCSFPAVVLTAGDREETISPDSRIFTPPIPQVEYDYRK